MTEIPEDRDMQALIGLRTALIAKIEALRQQVVGVERAMDIVRGYKREHPTPPPDEPAP